MSPSIRSMSAPESAEEVLVFFLPSTEGVGAALQQVQDVVLDLIHGADERRGRPVRGFHRHDDHRVGLAEDRDVRVVSNKYELTLFFQRAHALDERREYETIVQVVFRLVEYQRV